jgi:RNA-directed DNA polymerase
MSNTQSQQLMVEWHSINWRKLERRVYKLQKRIYRASQRGDVKAVRRLQKTLMKSWSARCLAVRRVTQDNTGKKTAGVDGIKSLSPEARQKLVNNLKLGSKVSPTIVLKATIFQRNSVSFRNILSPSIEFGDLLTKTSAGGTPTPQ